MQTCTQHGFFDGGFPQCCVGVVGVESGRELLAAEYEWGEASAYRFARTTWAYQENISLGEIQHSWDSVDVINCAFEQD